VIVPRNWSPNVSVRVVTESSIRGLVPLSTGVSAAKSATVENSPS
jgi:hypothetical protein